MQRFTSTLKTNIYNKTVLHNKNRDPLLRQQMYQERAQNIQRNSHSVIVERLLNDK